MYRILTFPPLYFFLGILLEAINFWLFHFYTLIKYPFNWLGLVPFIVGLRILRQASVLFNKRETTFLLEAPSEFVVEGLFRYSRNPMYLGSLLFLFGLSVIFGNVTALLIPILFFFAMNNICIPPEEKLMQKTFGNKYLTYKQETRRWI